MSCRVVLSCLFLSCVVFTVLCYLVLSCLALCCVVMSSLVFSCLVLPCLVLSCLVLPCDVLCCFVSSCVVLCYIVSYVVLCCILLLTSCIFSMIPLLLFLILYLNTLLSCLQLVILTTIQNLSSHRYLNPRQALTIDAAFVRLVLCCVVLSCLVLFRSCLVLSCRG